MNSKIIVDLCVIHGRLMNHKAKLLVKLNKSKDEKRACQKLQTAQNLVLESIELLNKE
jgi:hypothetical protein